MSRRQNPLFGYQHSGAVEYLIRAAEDCGQKRPVTRQRWSAAHDPLIHGLRSPSDTALCDNHKNLRDVCRFDGE